jgi:hypothetical protein
MIRFLLDRYFIKQPQLRAVVTKLLYGKRDREVNIFGCQFVVNSLRENGYVRAVRKMEYSSLLRDEVGVLLSLSMLLQDGDAFVDVGANVGLFCCTLSRKNRLNTSAKSVSFYAYEPNPDTFLRLQRNIAGRGIIGRNVAVSDKMSEQEFIAGAAR